MQDFEVQMMDDIPGIRLASDGDEMWIDFFETLEFHRSFLEREIDRNDLSHARLILANEIPKGFQAHSRLSVEFENDNEIHIQFFIGPIPEAPIGDIIDTYWDVAAAMANVSDPGTFGSPYMFDTYR